MVVFTYRGTFSKTEQFLRGIVNRKYMKNAKKFAADTTEKLVDETPVDTGMTAASWFYEVTSDKEGITITWCNDNLCDAGIPVIALIMYGHVNSDGTYVAPNNFVTPITMDACSRLSEDAWKEVTML